MTKKASLQFSVVAGMALLCANAWAGLGKIHVRSNLGEPFRAEIPLTGADAAATRVGLAGSNTFREFQIDYSGILSSLRFSIARTGSGAVVRVTSTQPINEPFLRFVVEAQSNASRSVREYTVLLDPPEFAIRQPERVVQDAPSYADENLSQRFRGRVRDQFGGQVARPRARPGELYAAPGSTLASLAGRARPQGVTLSQTMAALVQANPRAFINGNPDLLKSGAMLKVPPTVMIRAIDVAEAKRILAGQAAPVLAEQKEPAKAPPTVPSTTVQATPAPAPGKPAPGVLKLMPPGEAGATADARLSELEQQVAARDKTLKSAEERIAALEAELRSMKGGPLIGSAPVAAPASVPAAAHPAAMPAPTQVVKPATPSVPPPPPEPSWTDRLLSNLPLIGGGVVAALLAGLLGFKLVQRRRKGGAAKPAAAAAAAAAAVRAPAAAAPTAGGHSFMSDFTRSFGEIDAGEVDPIAEAEVYIAYGRDEQAEEILKDALARDPARHEVRMKLLEIYAGREDKANFERVAKELHAAFDGKGQLWAKAAAMGLALDPGNPLYQMTESSAPAPAAPIEPAGGMIDLDQELMGMQAQQPVEEAQPLEELTPEFSEPVAEPQPESDEDALRAALFGEEEAKPEPVVHASENMLDFDLDSLAEEAAQEAAKEEKPAEEPSNLLDFDFPMEEPAEKAAEPEPPAAEPESPLGDFGALYEEEPAQPPGTGGITVSDDPLSTKLDLAKVYLDMGDSEGAREVLKELVDEAQGPLKDEAQALLAKLGG